MLEWPHMKDFIFHAWRDGYEIQKKAVFVQNIYTLPPTDDIFIGAMKANIAFHAQQCPDYGKILNKLDFDFDSVNGIDDLYKIPPLPTSYLKNNTLLSKPYDKLFMKTTSSGTGGKKTLSGFDFSSALCAFFMVLKVFRYHKLISPRLTNYIILGYQPDESNQSATAKALKGVTILAIPKTVRYALKFENGEYQADTEGIIDSMIQFGKQNTPVRIIGFPAYLKMFIDELDERNIKLNLHKDSKILLGGGWKTFFSEEVSKTKLFNMANQTLGIRRENFKDHFSTAEHPINYISCKNGHFHVPVFSRAIIRDVNTLEPVPNGTPGLLNLITPLLSSAPYGSILTDDIAVMKNGDECGCGISSPYFELIGSVGLASIKTCAQAASEYLNNV